MYPGKPRNESALESE